MMRHYRARALPHCITYEQQLPLVRRYKAGSRILQQRPRIFRPKDSLTDNVTQPSRTRARGLI